jgi:CheY-like chemotaxis protein
VILLDAAMAGVDAGALIRELERSVETRSSVVVLTCPREMHDTRVAELEASGALLVLVKPLTRDGLLQALSQALAESRARGAKSRRRRAA